MRYSDYTSSKATPQTEAIFGQNQVKNNTGGFVYAVDKWDQLLRFLILGSEGGSYYVGERALTLDNAKNVLACIKEDGVKVVKTIVEVSDAGRAPKNDQAIFALALVATHADANGKQAAYRALGQVCRIGTHLFQFVQNVQDMRGWSRGLRRAVSRWYLSRDNGGLEYQLAKYQSRNGVSHRDVLRLAHVKPTNVVQNELFKIAVGKGQPTENTPFFAAMETIKSVKDEKRAAKIIIDSRLTREMVPTEFLNKPVTQDALLHNMPIGAMLRNLGSFTASGFLSSNLQPAVKYVRDTIANIEALQKGRIHPLAVLNALRVYTNGHGDKGKLSWKPVTAITDALNEAFYLAFQAVEPTGKNFMLALDVSGSMGGATINGMA